MIVETNGIHNGIRKRILEINKMEDRSDLFEEMDFSWLARTIEEFKEGNVKGYYGIDCTWSKDGDKINLDIG